jgi:2-polyprenyl-3-methyl-5-hydroxy-6-metoxy-1,4-benzoquinol methylase
VTDEVRAGDEHRRATWERKWAQPDFVPAFGIKSIPPEVRQVVEDGWFPSGASVLDVGCGDGALAAWLAEEGYDVVGVDFAAAAIAKAERAYRGVKGLEFEVVDICEGPPTRTGFGALLDRGCLQGIPPDAVADYVRNVTAASAPGARFLLLHRLHTSASAEQTAANLEEVFRGTFDVVRFADTEIAADPSRFPEPMRGVACWLVRR